MRLHTQSDASYGTRSQLVVVPSLVAFPISKTMIQQKLMVQS